MGTRIVSGVVLIAIVVSTLWLLPPWATVALAAIAAAIAAGELAGLSAKLGAQVSPLFTALTAAIACVAFVVADADPSTRAAGTLAAVLLAFVVVSGAVALAQGPPDASTVQRAAVLFMAPIYIGLPLGAIAWIRWARGPEAVLLLVALVATSDSAQYFTGRAFGRRKLAPVVSPAKTVEGGIGGLVAAAVLGAVLSRYWLPGLSLATGALLGLVLAAVGIVGDLFKSSLKRSAGVKDSSSLIPGHGGVLDRLDSYLFAAPLYYLFLRHIA